MSTPLSHLLELPDDLGAYEPLVERAPMERLIRAPSNARDEIKARAESVASMLSHGLEVDVDEEEETEALVQFNREIQQLPISSASFHKPAVVLKLAGLLSEYDHEVVRDAVQMRQYVTNRLLEESDPKMPASQRMAALKALGSITEVGLFTERSEVTVKQLPQESLEATLYAKLKTLLPTEVEVVDIPPKDTPAA